MSEEEKTSAENIDEYRIRMTVHINTDDDIAYHKPGFDTDILLATFKDYDSADKAFFALVDMFSGSNSRVGDTHGRVTEVRFTKNIRCDIGTYEKPIWVYEAQGNTRYLTEM